MSNVKIGEIPSLEPPESRSRRVPASMTAAGLSIVTRAVGLKLATRGETRECDPELYGSALEEIAAEWLAREVVRLSERKAVCDGG